MSQSNSLHMDKIKDLLSNERLQFWILIGISVVVIGFTVILYFSDNQLFQRFLGGINPVTAFLVIAVLAVLFSAFLLSQDWFAIYKKENLKGLMQAAGIASLLGIVMILMDHIIVFPADTNILFPKSLLFYPAIAYFVEILFHIIPLTFLLIFLTSIFKNSNIENLIWISILIIALLEPVYQTANMFNSNQFPTWAVIYVWIHIFLINLFQLYFFKRYDFVTMYSFRLVYYVIWHIGWGWLRLKLLF